MNGEYLRGITSWTILITITVLLAAVFFTMLYQGVKKELFATIAQRHFPVVVCIPIAAISALFGVIILGSIVGPIKFKVPGFEFEGASGPVILWAICFWAMVQGIWLLWDKRAE